MFSQLLVIMNFIKSIINNKKYQSGLASLIYSIVTVVYYVVLYRKINIFFGDEYLKFYIQMISVVSFFSLFYFGLNTFILRNGKEFFNSDKRGKENFFHKIKTIIIFGTITNLIIYIFFPQILTTLNIRIVDYFAIQLLVISGIFQNFSSFFSAWLDSNGLIMEKFVLNILITLLVILFMEGASYFNPIYITLMYNFLLTIILLGFSIRRIYKKPLFNQQKSNENIKSLAKLKLPETKEFFGYFLLQVPALLFDLIIKMSFSSAVSGGFVAVYDLMNKGLQVLSGIFVAVSQVDPTKYRSIKYTREIFWRNLKIVTLTHLLIILAFLVLGIAYLRFNSESVLVLCFLIVAWSISAIGIVPYLLNIFYGKIRNNIISTYCMLFILIFIGFGIKNIYSFIYGWMFALCFSGFFLIFSERKLLFNKSF